MPRGVPKAGFRNRNNVTVLPTKSVETDSEISNRIGERFEILDLLTKQTVYGDGRALIISGPPGLGKSFQVENILKQYDESEETFKIVKGYCRATGLMRLLHEYRHEGNCIVFDDSDSIFNCDTSLNLLKAVLDTTEKRHVSWLSEGRLVDEDTGEAIPQHFEFNGSIIFITNLDFDSLIHKQHKLAPHLEALQSRAHYLDLTLKTPRDYLIRILDVIDGGMLGTMSNTMKADVIKFLTTNYLNVRELSLRTAIKLKSIREHNDNWEKIARITMIR